MASKDQQIADDIITRAIDINRFAAGERARVFEILKRLEEDLIDLLLFSGRALTEATKAEKTRLLQQAQQAIEQYYSKAADVGAEAMLGAAQVEAAATAKSISGAFNAVVSVNLPPEKFFETLVRDTMIQKAPSAAWWARQAGDTAFRFRNEVAYGIAQGESNAQIITRIRGRAAGFEMVEGKRVYRYEGGVMGVSRANAAALVQTSVQTAANEARRATFEENGDILKGIRQLSTLDSHTTVVCVGYSGAAWKLDAARTPIPPNTLPYAGGTPRHWNCRSVETPITKTFKELGLDIPEPPETTRAATGGPVAAGTTFAEFLERKGPKFARDTLGEGRAELWRQGKITLRQLLDDRGRVLSLAELKRKYG